MVKTHVSRLITKLGSRDRIQLVVLGFEKADVIHRLLAHSVALLCLSRYDSFGIPLAEAMAAGTPVLYVPNAGLPEVAGDVGLTVDPTQPQFEGREEIELVLDGPTKLLWLNADGLSGEEGTFVICSFWLVSCLAQTGELERAGRLFERLCGFANDLGLLAEEIDGGTGELLGNFPQAFSHIGLIGAAWEIDQARAKVR